MKFFCLLLSAWATHAYAAAACGSCSEANYKVEVKGKDVTTSCAATCTPKTDDVGDFVFCFAKAQCTDAAKLFKASGDVTTVGTYTITDKCPTYSTCDDCVKTSSDGCKWVGLKSDNTKTVCATSGMTTALGTAVEEVKCTSGGCADCPGGKKYKVEIKGKSVATGCVSAADCVASTNPQDIVQCFDAADCAHIPAVPLNDKADIKTSGSYTSSDKCLDVVGSCKSCLALDAALECEYLKDQKGATGCLPKVIYSVAAKNTYVQIPPDQCPPDSGVHASVATLAAAAVTIAAWII